MSYVVASFSGGKDSTAMVLHMIELGEQLDEVVTCDTGMEFPAMYEHIEKVRRIIEGAGIKYTTLRADRSFEDYLLRQNRKKYDTLGWGWPGPHIRWCTKYLKTKMFNSYIPKDAIQCIGLAADETARLERENNTQKNHRHPLAEWGWTEADCMAYCEARGYDWGGLYKIFHRVSCWCCPLQAIGELRNLWKYYPELWAKLEAMDERMRKENIGYKGEYKGLFKRAPDGVKGYARRFEKEARAERAQTTLISYIEEEKE